MKGHLCLVRNKPGAPVPGPFHLCGFGLVCRKHLCAFRMQMGRGWLVPNLPGGLQLDAFADGRFTPGKIIDVEELH